MESKKMRNVPFAMKRELKQSGMWPDSAYTLLSDNLESSVRATREEVYQCIVASTESHVWKKTITRMCCGKTGTRKL